MMRIKTALGVCAVIGLSGCGDRTYKLGSGITSEYGRYVESPGVPVGDLVFFLQCSE